MSGDHGYYSDTGEIPKGRSLARIHENEDEMSQEDWRSLQRWLEPRASAFVDDYDEEWVDCGGEGG